MFIDDRCSIYTDRPRACRVYDCRVFAASDAYPEEPEKSGVATTARRWVFSYRADSDRRRHQAVRDRARALRAPVERSPRSFGTPSATDVAIRTISEIAES